MKILIHIVLCSFWMSGFAQKPAWQSVFVSQSEVGSTAYVDMIYAASGGLYITGNFDQELTIADTTVWSAGGQDAFVAKLDSNYDLEWLCVFGGPGNDAGHGLAKTGSGDVVFSGFFNDSIQIDSNQYFSKGEDDILLISISSLGQINWVKTAGGSGMDFPGKGIEIDNDDNIYFTGYFGDNGHSPPFQLSAYFDSIKVTAVKGGDVFLAKYSGKGNLVWVRTAGGNYSDISRGISVVGDRIAITGDFTDPWIEFGNSKLYSKEGPFQDMFVACYDTAGNFLWARGAGNKNPVGGISVVIDSTHNCFVAGTYFDDNLSFGNYTLPTIGDFDIFIARYDSSGNFNWTKNIGGGSTDNSGRLDLDSSGNLYVAGIYSYDAIFADDTVFGLRRDIFITKLSTTGIFQWVATAEGGGVEFVDVLMVISPNEIYVVGSFDSPTLTFGDITVQNAGERNFFIAKLGPDTSTGIAEENGYGRVQVYPNPVSEGSEVTIAFASRMFQTIAIHDLQGREVMRMKIAPTVSHQLVDVSSWSKGIYFIRLRGEEEITKPLIKN